MPVEMLQQPQRKLTSAAAGAAPPRLRPKRPVGLDFYRIPATAGSPKQSAVERLEADKAKYVKSQVALSKKQPVKPPELKQPLLHPSTPLRPTRKIITTKTEEVQLDLKHLSNLISNVPDGPQSRPVSLSEGARAPDCAGAAHNSISDSPTCVQQVKKKLRPPPRPPPRPVHSSPAKVGLKAPGPVTMENPGSPGAVGTVRRVDVMPQLGPVRMTCRPPQYIRQPLQPRPLQYQQPLLPAPSYQRLFQPRAPQCPRKPVDVSVKLPSSSSPPAAAPAAASPPSALPAFPPPSPSIARLSSTSSRKRPSLTRSKSDMSDRYSRAGTELERFFNLCGLDPSDLQELAASSSDIVSLARFRSVSAPGSECGGSDRGSEDDEEKEDEEAGKEANRVPYGVSVIERNARVIKWLYGLRQAKENTSTSTNL